MAKSFKTSKHKLSSIWESTEQSRVDMLLKANALKKFKNIQKLKNDQPVHDTGWINIDRDAFSVAFTTQKGSIIPVKYNFNYETNLKVPDRLLPFIQWSLQVQGLPTSKVKPYVQYTLKQSGSQVTIRGGGTQIYQAPGTGVNIATRYFQDDIDSGIVNEDFLKPTWLVNIQYTFDGKKNRASGYLSGLEAHNVEGGDEIVRHANITGTQDFPESIIRTINNGVVSGNFFNDDAASYSNTSVNLSSQDRVLYFLDNFAGVQFSQETSPGSGVFTPINYLSVDPDDYGFDTVDFDFVFEATRFGVSDVTITFAPAGSWLYYDEDTNNRISVGASPLTPSDTCRETESTLHLLNLPATAEISYTTLEFEVKDISIETPTEELENSDEIYYFKKGDGNYQFFYSAQIQLIEEASNFAFQDTREEYTIVYHPDDDFFAQSTVTCNATDRDNYSVPEHQLSVRLVGRLVNPLYWTEKKRFTDVS